MKNLFLLLSFTFCNTLGLMPPIPSPEARLLLNREEQAIDFRVRQPLNLSEYEPLESDAQEQRESSIYCTPEKKKCCRLTGKICGTLGLCSLATIIIVVVANYCI